MMKMPAIKKSPTDNFPVQCRHSQISVASVLDHTDHQEQMAALSRQKEKIILAFSLICFTASKQDDFITEVCQIARDSWLFPTNHLCSEGLQAAEAPKSVCCCTCRGLLASASNPSHCSWNRPIGPLCTSLWRDTAPCSLGPLEQRKTSLKTRRRQILGTSCGEMHENAECKSNSKTSNLTWTCP